MNDDPVHGVPSEGDPRRNTLGDKDETGDSNRQPDFTVHRSAEKQKNWAQSVEFLQHLRPGGPWVLTAIMPDGPTKTITTQSADEVIGFIREYNGQCNIHYSVNPLRRAVSKKATKLDVAAIEFIFADLDPHKDETPEAAKTRYLAQLKEFEPQPTAGIDSGNGIQGLFKLNERIVLDGSSEDQNKIEDVEARTLALTLRLGGTAGTQNIDRILRLPGTTNLPNEVKKKAGRVPCPAALLWFNGATAALEAFPKAAAPPPPPPPEDTPSGNTIKLPSMVAALLHIVGSGPYETRSHLLFAFITTALRARVSNADIVAACLDAGHAGCGIYEHCKENGGRAYVERQIKQARKTVRDARSEMETDLGNARRLVRLHGEDLRYVHAWRSWLAWEDGHWRKDGDGFAMRQAKATIEEMFVEAGQINNEARRTAMRKHALQSQNAPRLAAMIKLAESEIEVVLAVEKLDADPLLLGVKNGVIDLRTCTFREARRQDYVTKLAGTAYDPKARCPNWEAFLKKITSEEIVKYLQRATGYLLTGLTGEEVMWVLWGIGSNGKSTLRETLFALLGDYAVGADASLLITNRKSGGATPDLARLHGRRLVTINETERNAILNEARMKFITSHDQITARNLYQEPFDFPPTHKTFLTTNDKPIIRATDEGTWRRIHYLAFIEVIKKEERNVNFREQMLLPELPGILNWALDGLKSYQSEGLNPPKAVLDATKEYRDDMDLIGIWIDERCALDPTSEVTNIELYLDYEKWAGQEVGFKMTAIAFGRELAKRDGVKSKKVKGKRGFRGLKLAPPM